MAEALRLTATLLAPVMPATTEKVYAALGGAPAENWRAGLEWGDRLKGGKTQAALVLFPRPPQPEATAPAKR